MAQVLAIANPLRLDRREAYVVPAGTTVEGAMPSGWVAAIARVNGDVVDKERVLGHEDCLVLIQKPEGFVPIAVNLLISIAISAAFALLFPPPQAKQDRDDESSPTYGFSGVSNDRAEGNAIPIVYGRVKVGGTIVNEFVEVQGLPPKSTLRQLISFGEGPIEAIGSVTEPTPAAVPLTEATLPAEVLINDNPAQNFRDVKAWVRLGDNEQELVPGFNETRSTFAVGVDLTAATEGDIPASGTAALVAGFSIAGDDEFTTANDAVWTSDGVTFDLSSEIVDGFVWTLRFPGGFYGTDTQTGATIPAFLRYQVRYIELDSGGVPISTGGYAGDGYVRLPTVGPIPLAQRSGFQIQFSERFQDPQTYTPATPGTALLTTTTSGSNASYAVSTGGWATGQEIPFLSGFAWVRIDAVGEYRIMASTTNSPERGFALEIVERVFSNGPTGINRHVLQLRIGRGSRFLNFFAGTRTISLNAPTSVADGLFEADAVGQYVHVGFSYLQNDRVLLCVNGRVIPSVSDPFESPPNIDLEWVRQPLAIGGRAAAAAAGTLAVDEVKLYSAALGQPDFAADYAAGNGTVGPQLGLEDRMVFRAPFEDVAGSSTFTSANQWYATTPTLNAGATSGVESGIVRSGAAGQLKRSRYRVEILRISQRSTRASVANDVEVQDIQSVISKSFTYPNSPLLGIEIDASEQLNDGIPTTTAIIKGVKCPIWDGASTVIPAIRYEWSANPAWVALELILNRRYGLGRFYSFRSVDLEQFKAWADYCDEIVYDGRPRLTVDNPGVLNDADLLFDNSVVDPDTGETRGALWFEVGVEEQNSLSVTWEPGSFLRLSNWPDDTNVGVNNNVDSPDATGYEIYSVELIDGVWTVKCYWDRTTETDPWLSGSRLGADILTPVDLDGSIVEGASRRFEFNGVFDKIRPAWDALLDICAVGRATPVPIGSTLSVRYSHPRLPLGVLTPSNIKAGSFTVDYSSERTRPNALTLNILDREQNFEPVPVQVQTDDLQDVTNETFIRQENKSLFGVTDVGQAERHGNFVLNTNKLQKRSGRFEAALDALPYQVGDLLRVSSEVLPRGDAGRCLSSSISNNTNALSDREDFSGAAWTASSVVVVANIQTDPYGDTVADNVSGTGYLEQLLDFGTEIADGWISVSILVRRRAGVNVFEMEVVSERASSSAYFDIDLIAASSDDSFDQPVRARVQDMGGGWRYCTASFFVKPPDGQAFVAPPLLRLYPNQGAASGDVYLSKVLATQAEYAAPFVGNRGVVIDRDVTLAAATTYSIHLQDFRGNVATGTVDTTLTPVGSYTAGDTLFLTSDLGTIPVRGSSYIVSSSAEQLIVEIAGIRRLADLSAEFTWVEYVEAVYSDDAKEDTGGDEIIIGPNVREAPFAQPFPPLAAAGSDTLTEPTPGDFETRLFVSWENDPATRTIQTGSRVLWRKYDEGAPDQGAWSVGQDVSGLETEAEIALPGIAVGDFVEVSVVPQSAAFRSLRAERGTRFVYQIRGLAWKPEPPTGITAELEDLRATYAVTLADDNSGAGRSRVLRTEFRRGAWILGQVVGVTEEGSRELITTDIYEDPTGSDTGTIYARNVSRAGVYSDEVSVDPAFTIFAAVGKPNLAMGGEEEWETSQAGNWLAPVPPVGGPDVTGALDENVAGYLEFVGSGLQGTYFTAWDNLSLVGPGQSQAPRPLLVMAAVDAEQVYPTTIGVIGDTLEEQRWTPEGPSQVADTDDPNCTLTIQIQVNVDGSPTGWSEWATLTNGVYEAVDVRLRLLATRPNDTYNIRIHRFHHKIVVPRRSVVEQGPQELHARTEVI